uniref:Uncharacterized protein n=1 Tax=Fagus sylvatica TaxID=28930 RepID=A0A2N9FAL8_FAGSY
MAPPINPFKPMGKTAGASPSETGRGKGKGNIKGAEAGKKLKKSTVDIPVPEVATQTTADQEPPRPPPTVHNLEGSDHAEELAPRKKRGRTGASSVSAEGSFSNFEAWAPELLFGPGPYLSETPF